jgi:hypothetical protein
VKQGVMSARNVVLVGSFNPVIFHPNWFAKVNLLPPEEAEAATEVLVSGEASRFALPWIDCIARRDRLQLLADSEYQGELRDVVTGLLEVLSATPVAVVGINTDVHAPVSTIDLWHALGNRLAPKEGLWGDLFDDPGLSSMKVQGRRGDPHPGFTNVTVEPSNRIQPGLYINVNDHFDLRENVEGTDDIQADRDSPPDFATWLAESALGSGPALDLIEANWNDSMIRSDLIVERVLSWA